MTNRDLIVSVMRTIGIADAAGLRTRAAGMSDTAVIAEEHKIPAWDESKDYSGWPSGAPVAYDGQVYGLLQPHHAAHYPGSNPGNTPALWGVKHTEDPAMAKPYIAPLGTSGLYMDGECCVWGGKVWRCINDNTAYSPGEYADYWEEV